MTDEERIQAALEEVRAMSKEIEEISKLDFDAIPAGRGGSRSKKIEHGEVIIRAKNGIVEEGVRVSPPPLSEPVSATLKYQPESDAVDASFVRTVTPMRSKHQRTSMLRIWKYRNFKRCGTCGTFDNYESRDLTATKGVEIWCYQCGAQDQGVKQAWDEPDGPKFKPIECAYCGKRIWFTRGEKMFPTGDTDRATGRPDYVCEKCKPTFEADKKAKK